MKHLHTLGLFTTAALGALLGTSALAQDSYYYGGVGVGQARVRIDDTRITERLQGNGLATSGIAHNERDTTYKVFGGYQFNRSWGMEVGFFKLGTHGYTATTVPSGTLDGQFRVQGANIGIVGTLPFTEKLSGLARVGVQHARTRANLTGTGAVVVSDPTPSDRETNAKIGVGLQYAFSPSFQVRAEVERFRVSDAVGNHPRVAVYSVSMVFPFGRSGAPSRRASAAPAYVAPVALAPAAPAPQVVLAPLPPAVAVAAFAPPQSRRVSYSAESFFAFDRAELQPAGMSALDGFASDLAGTTYDRVSVQGHADRIGSTEYNQTLSLARAEAVKSYLVTSGRLDPAKIAAVGKSELEPVTIPDACQGNPSPAVIACLQPDRRVDIEVTGTR